MGYHAGEKTVIIRLQPKIIKPGSSHDRIHGQGSSPEDHRRK